MRLKYLRTKPRKVIEASPCIVEMGAMIQCWTASGVDDAKCAQTAKMLADCMKNLVRFFEKGENVDPIEQGWDITTATGNRSGAVYSKEVCYRIALMSGTESAAICSTRGFQGQRLIDQGT